MTRAKDISKIVTDANLSGTLDVTGTVTAGGLDIQGDGTISGGSRLTISDIADENNDGIRLDDSTTARFNNLTQDSSGNFRIQHWTGSAWQNNFTVTTGGSVGISNASPNANTKLDVNGAARIGNNTDGIMIENNTGSFDIANASYIRRNSSSGALEITSGSTTARDMIFNTGTNGAESFRISSSGNVGIGNSSIDTTTQISKSTTSTDGSVYPTLKVENTSAGSGNSYARFQVNGGNGTSGFTLLADGRSSNSDISLRTTTNTPMSFYTNNAERMVIDSSGLSLSSGNVTVIDGQGYYFGDGSYRIEGKDDGANARIGFVTGGSERMRIDGNGNVGIGNTASGFNAQADNLVVGTGSGANGITIYSGSDSTGDIFFADGTTGSDETRGGINYNHSNNSMNFRVNDAPRMYIHSGGATTFGLTDPSPYVGTEGFVVALNNGARYGAIFGCDTVANREAVLFVNPNGAVGSIRTNSSSTAYNTSSDHRLKENVTADWDATTRLKQLNPVRFNFIADADDTTVDGFLAHEVQSVVPEAISGTHNEVDDDGNPVYQGIDQSKLVPLLVKTIQELEARITTLENGV